MTYNDMLRIAMEQSAEDLGCKADDFNKRPAFYRSYPSFCTGRSA